MKAPPLGRRCFWVHAASGEFEYAKSVIRQIKENTSNSYIVVTYSSPSYAAQINKFPFTDECLPLPFDLVGAISSFLKTYQPEALLLARSDLWPEMLYQCKKRDIPRVLFAAAFKGKPSGLGGLWKKLNYKMISHFYMNRPEDVDLLKSWNLPGHITSTGDPRFDEALLRKNNNKNEIHFSAQKPTLIAGSTWAEDEAQLLPAITEFIKNNKLQFIIAPHEVDTKHLNAIKIHFDNQHIAYESLSELLEENRNTLTAPVLIIDRIGHLADFYKVADFSFIGGSYKKRVHSIMESLVENRPVIVGPHYENSPEALEFLDVQSEGLSAISVTKNKQQLESAVQVLITNARDIQYQIELKVNASAGASKRIFEDMHKNGIV